MFRLPIVILLLHSGLAADAGEPPRAQAELSPAVTNRLKEVWASQEQRLADESNATVPGEEAKPTQGLLLTISPASHEETGTSKFAQYRDALFYTDESLVLSISLKNTTDQPLTCYSKGREVDLVFNVRNESHEATPALRYDALMKDLRNSPRLRANVINIPPGEEVVTQLAINRRFDFTLADNYLITAFQSIPNLNGDGSVVIQSNTILIQVHEQMGLPEFLDRAR